MVHLHIACAAMASPHAWLQRVLDAAPTRWTGDVNASRNIQRQASSECLLYIVDLFCKLSVYHQPAIQFASWWHLQPQSTVKKTQA